MTKDSHSKETLQERRARKAANFAKTYGGAGSLTGRIYPELREEKRLESDNLKQLGDDMLNAFVGASPETRTQEPDEVIEETQWISSEYLSAACKMVALQFAHAHAITWPETKDEFHERVTRVFRQHCPIAYSYFFTNSTGNIIPTGTVDIILEYIWATPDGKNFLGGKNNGIILPGQ